VFNKDYFIKLAKKREPGAQSKTGKVTTSAAERLYERWKVRSRDYGLERPDAYSQAMPRKKFFALDALGAFDAIWAILGPPHPLEAAPIGGRERGEAREYELLESGQDRFGAGEEPLPIEHELSDKDWEREWEGHSMFWGGTGFGTGAKARPQAARHYAIYPGVQRRLLASEAYVDPGSLVSSLPPILTDKERKEAFRMAALEAKEHGRISGQEDYVEIEGDWWKPESKRKKPRKKKKRRAKDRYASDDLTLKLDELEAQLGVDTLMHDLKIRKGTLTKIRNKTESLSPKREQAIHSLYGKVFGGPVPKIKGVRRRSAPKAKKALGELVSELGEKKAAERLMEASGARKPFTRHRVNLKVLQLRRWLGPWLDAKGKKHKPVKIADRSIVNISRLYDQVIKQVHVPEKPDQEWQAILSFVLDRVSQNKLSKRLGTSRGSINNWIKGAHPPSIIMQEKLAQVAEEVRDIPRDHKKGMRPGREARAAFVPPADTPADVVAALRLIQERLPKKEIEGAVGVTYQTWRGWAQGHMKGGKRRRVPASRWPAILQTAYRLDPSFPLPDPEILQERMRLRDVLGTLLERAGHDRLAHLIGIEPAELTRIMESPVLPPGPIVIRIYELASAPLTYEQMGREKRKGFKRTISDVVPGWRDMLRELNDQFPSRNALKDALHRHGFKTTGAAIKRVLAGEQLVSHKGQHAIAALHQATAEAA
jgi:transcriptional regulator with XRE-family HTH domain